MTWQTRREGAVIYLFAAHVSGATRWLAREAAGDERGAPIVCLFAANEPLSFRWFDGRGLGPASDWHLVREAEKPEAVVARMRATRGYGQSLEALRSHDREAKRGKLHCTTAVNARQKKMFDV